MSIPLIKMNSAAAASVNKNSYLGVAPQTDRRGTYDNSGSAYNNANSNR